MAQVAPDPPPIKGVVPFSFFSSLVRNIAKIKPSETKDRLLGKKGKKTWPPSYPALETFKRWITTLHNRYAPLPPGTTEIVFRFLFPEEDWKRKYHLQEKQMTELLSDCLGVPMARFEGWQHEKASGCLGDEVTLVLDKSCSKATDHESPLSLSQVATLLDELASLSPFTHNSIRKKNASRRKRSAIICALFRPLSPSDAGVLTQIILKDMRPILYPLTTFDPTRALIDFNAAAVTMLTHQHAMWAWDPTGRFARYYRVRAALEAAAEIADKPAAQTGAYDDIQPMLNQPIAVPKSEKGQHCVHALSLFRSSGSVWAETKYDGERAQIHVRIRDDGSSAITIFSKSRRESTQDRAAVHDIIRAALGLPIAGASTHASQTAGFTQNIILDAEMVAFSGDTVAEFRHIAHLIEATAKGVRGRRKTITKVECYATDSEDEEKEEIDEDTELSLGLVFFDVMYRDNKSLLGEPYHYRREILENIINVKPGSAIIASRYEIELNKQNPTKAENKLRWIFAHHIANHEEGLVLKAHESKYNELQSPWVKLKKDYITGHGDSVDLVLIGGSWEKERGRSLRVSPSVLTTFYIGALENKEDMDKPGFKPRFYCYFSVAYGFNRQQLDDINFRFKNSATVSSDRERDLPYDVSFLPGMKPTTILCTPLVVELFGAGFTVAKTSHYYELRFPRIIKYYRPAERSWKDTVSLHELQDIARCAVGRESSQKIQEDLIRSLYQQSPLPGIKSPEQHNQRTVNAYNDLAKTEKTKLWDKGEPKHVYETPVMKTWQKDSFNDDGWWWGSQREGPTPLAVKTNIFQTEKAPEQPLSEILVPTAITSQKQAAMYQPPLTPPTSSPIAKTQKRPASPEAGPSGRRKKMQKTTAGEDIASAVQSEAARTSMPSETMPASDTAVNAAPTNAALAIAAVSKPTGEVETTTIAAPPGIELESTLVHFALRKGGCACYKAWKRLVPKPVHSLRSLLIGCGWTKLILQSMWADLERGVIIIDGCVEGAEERWKKEIESLMDFENVPIERDRRFELLVYSCRSNLPLYCYKLKS